MKGMVEITYDCARSIYVVWYWTSNWNCERRGARKTLTAARNLANRLGVIYSEPAH